MITGPKLQMPGSLSNMFVVDEQSNIVSMKPEWAALWTTLTKTVFSNTRAGPSNERPTALMTGRYLGMPFFDTSLSTVIFLQSTNPDVWRIGAATVWGTILGSISSQTDLVLGTAASTASSTYALAGGAGSGTLTSVAISSAVVGVGISGSPITGAAGTITLTGGPFGSGTLTSIALSSAISGLTISGSPVTGAAGTITLGGYPGLTFASSAAQTTISLGLNTFSTATSISCSTGTWLINAQILVGMDGATSETHFTARLNDGTNSLANGAVSIITTLASSYASIPLGCIVKYGAPSTVSLQAAGDVTGGFIRGWPWQNSAGSTASMIQAMRLA